MSHLYQARLSDIIKRKKDVTTIEGGKNCVRHNADPWTERRMQGSRKHFEVIKGYYLPARVMNNLKYFPKDAIVRVIGVKVDKYTGDILGPEHREREDRFYNSELALEIAWFGGCYRFVLIKEENFYE